MATAEQLDGTGNVSQHPVGRMTERQREVLACVRRGLSNREIASELGITEEGVKAHLARLYLRLGVRNRVQLITETEPLLDGDDSGAPLGSLRVMATAARRGMRTAETRARRMGNGGVDAQLESMRLALQSLDIALELVASLPPQTAGKALRVVRKRMSAALGALRELEAAVT